MGEQTIEELEIIIRAKVDDAIKGITAVTDAIKREVANSIKPMHELVGESKNIAKNVVSSTTTVTSQFLNYKNSVASTTAQQEILIRKIRDMQATLKMTNLKDILSENDILAIQAELEKVIKQFERLQKAEKSAKDEAEKTSKKATNSYNALWSSLKKGLVLVLGVQSAYSLLTQGINNAINSNDKLKARQEVTSNALGQVFTPIVERVTNAVQYCVIAIGLLIKMFTGIDVLARTTTKSMNKASGSVKNLSKQVSGIDDIDVLSSSKGSLASGLVADMSALAEFEQKIAEVEKKFNEWGIPEKVKKIKEAWRVLWDNYLHPALDWMLRHPEIITTLFGIILTGKLLSKINGLLGSDSAGTGLAGLIGNLNTLSAIGAIAITVGVAYQITKDIQELNLEKEWSYNQGREYARNTLQGWQDEIKEWSNNGTLQANIDDAYKKVMDSMSTNIVNIENTLTLGNKVFSHWFGGKKLKETKEQLMKINDQYRITVDSAETLLKNSDLTDDQYNEILYKLKDMYDSLKKNRYLVQDDEDSYEEINTTMGRILWVMGGITSGEYKLKGATDDVIQSNVNLKKVLEDSANVVKDKTLDAVTKMKSAFSNLVNKDYNINVDADTSKATSKISGIKTSLIDATNNARSKISEISNTLGNSLHNIFGKTYTLNVNGNAQQFESTFSNALKSAVQKAGSIFGSVSNIFSSSKNSSTAASSWIKDSLSKLNKFATGNVATSPTLGVFGEYAGAKSNPEITAPQSILKQTFREELSNTNNISGNNYERLIINLGPEKLFDMFTEYINNLNENNGISIIKEN